jgi:hypothetical protein
MANATDNNLFCFRVGKIKHPVIADADAKAVATFQFLAAVRKWIFFQCENGFADANLDLCRQPFEFLAGVTRDFDLPAHARMFSSFNDCRKDWRG